MICDTRAGVVHPYIYNVSLAPSVGTYVCCICCICCITLLRARHRRLIRVSQTSMPIDNQSSIADARNYPSRVHLYYYCWTKLKVVIKHSLQNMTIKFIYIFPPL